MRFIAALTAVTLLAACTPRSAPPQATTSGPVEERVFSVAGASGYDGPWIEFATRDRGYALFTSCAADSCKGLLFSTVDGGRTWKPREHPQPTAKNQQMYVADADTVVLMAEPDAWYVTRDGGNQWRRSAFAGGTPPPEYPFGDGGRFYVDDSGALRDRDHPGAQRRAPQGGYWLTNGPGNDLWLAGQLDGQPVTWRSRSGPDSFAQIPVPRQEGRSVMGARVGVSTDGDTWLIADPEPLNAGRDATARARGSILKATGVPLIWRLVDSSWVPVPTASVEEKPAWAYSATPAGGGLLLISGPEGLVQVRDRVVGTVREPVLGWIGQLRDGTLIGRDTRDFAVYLSAGPAAGWTKVVLSK
jgi:hypothetical protein